VSVRASWCSRWERTLLHYEISIKLVRQKNSYLIIRDDVIGILTQYTNKKKRGIEDTTTSLQ